MATQSLNPLRIGELSPTEEIRRIRGFDLGCLNPLRIGESLRTIR
jgi:hypothetical protein